MSRAIWNGVVIAESDTIEVVEGNIYFPPETVAQEFLTPSETTTVCGWKGTAHYYHLVVDGQTNEDAAWYYPEPKAAANNIRNQVAFWRGVEIEE